MRRKPDKTFRLLSISNRLIDGREVSLQSLAEEFGVTQMTIKRDINALRDYLVATDNKTYNAIAFNEARQTYFLIKPEREWVTAAEAVSVTDILLQSDRFTKDEAAVILHKIITQVDPKERAEAREKITEAYHSYNKGE